VTGGGQLTPFLSAPLCDDSENPRIATTIFPGAESKETLKIKKITHGGQLGAPYAVETCWNPNSPCIRGQWEHNRHYLGKGNIVDSLVVDNAHSNTPKGIFDMVKCACLACCDESVSAARAGEVLCNPDNRICGPEPRRAPANAIIFSGVAEYKAGNPGNGKGSSSWYVFRVYVEDRSEPGGAHPKGQTSPSDVYCFQAWKITGSFTDTVNDAVDLRRAIAEEGCAWISSPRAFGSLPPSEARVISYIKPGATTPTTYTIGTPDINDIGPLDRGNQQIHPSTSAECKQ